MGNIDDYIKNPYYNKRTIRVKKITFTMTWENGQTSSGSSSNNSGTKDVDTIIAEADEAYNNAVQKAENARTAVSNLNSKLSGDNVTAAMTVPERNAVYGGGVSWAVLLSGLFLVPIPVRSKSKDKGEKAEKQ